MKKLFSLVLLCCCFGAIGAADMGVVETKGIVAEAALLAARPPIIQMSLAEYGQAEAAGLLPEGYLTVFYGGQGVGPVWLLPKDRALKSRLFAEIVRQRKEDQESVEDQVSDFDVMAPDQQIADLALRYLAGVDVNWHVLQGGDGHMDLRKVKQALFLFNLLDVEWVRTPFMAILAGGEQRALLSEDQVELFENIRDALRENPFLVVPQTFASEGLKFLNIYLRDSVVAMQSLASKSGEQLVDILALLDYLGMDFKVGVGQELKANLVSLLKNRLSLEAVVAAADKLRGMPGSSEMADLGYKIEAIWIGFSPDGRFVWAMNREIEGRGQIQLYALGGESLQAVGDVINGNDLGFSPNGKWVWVIDSPGYDHRSSKIQIYRFDNGRLVAVGDLLDGHTPLFSPNGRLVVIWNLDKRSLYKFNQGILEKVRDLSPGEHFSYMYPRYMNDKWYYRMGRSGRFFGAFIIESALVEYPKELHMKLALVQQMLVNYLIQRWRSYGVSYALDSDSVLLGIWMSLPDEIRSYLTTIKVVSLVYQYGKLAKLAHRFLAAIGH